MPVRSSPADRADTPSDTAALVRAAQQGDRRAFGELYRRHARVVHGLLLTRLRPEDADDLVQEVFVRAMARIGALRDPSRFPSWLCAMARNAAVDHFRTPRVRAVHLELPAALAASDRPDTEARAILDAIRGLPRAYRETLVLRLVEGMTGPEIAGETGLTPDSLRVNLCRGLRLLRARLGARTR